jgi:hypothetical protein
MTEFEMGYVVALFEGEGTIYSYLEEGVRPRLRMSISMNDPEPLGRFRRYTGMGGIGGPYKRGDYIWHLGARDKVRELAALLRPHLSPRRQAQIDKAIPADQRD